MKSTCLTDGVTVRLADLQQPADGQTVAGLIDAYARDPMGGGTGLTAEVRQALPGQLARHPTAFALLAEADDQPVGVAVCVLGLSTFKAQPTVNLHDLTILPAALGRGIGRLLLDGVAAEARRRDACKVTLEVRPDNHVARALYDSAGFNLSSLGGQAYLMMEKLL